MNIRVKREYETERLKLELELANEELTEKLDKEFVGRGYMTEVVNKVLEIAFEDLKLHRIEANIMPRNIPSIKVVQKCGFEKEGVSKKYLNVNGVWEDHYHFVKLNGNWKE